MAETAQEVKKADKAEKMPKARRPRTAEQKRLEADLAIIVGTGILTTVVYTTFYSGIAPFIRNAEANILLRVLVAACFQFGASGLGITIVSLLRKESFASHGLQATGTLRAVLLSVLCCVPYAAFQLATGQVSGYHPFYTVWTTDDVLASGFPLNAISMLITAVMWGFFEGFNYAFVSDKINRRFPGKNMWLNWGAIWCAILCIVVHGAVGVTPDGIVQMLTIAALVYGMLLVRERTGNAWGCVFTFVFIWNAF